MITTIPSTLHPHKGTGIPCLHPWVAHLLLPWAVVPTSCLMGAWRTVGPPNMLSLKSIPCAFCCHSPVRRGFQSPSYGWGRGGFRKGVLSPQAPQRQQELSSADG